MNDTLYIHTILAASKEAVGVSIESIHSMFDYASHNDFPEEMVFAGWAWSDELFQSVDSNIRSAASRFKYKGKISVYRFKQNKGKPHVVNSVVDKHAGAYKNLMICDHDIMYNTAYGNMVGRAVSVLKDQHRFTGLKACRVSFNHLLNVKHAMGAYENHAVIADEDVFWGSTPDSIGPGCDIFDKSAFISIGGYSVDAGVFGPYHKMMSASISNDNMSSLLLDSIYVTHPLPYIDEYTKWKSAMIDTYGNRNAQGMPSDDVLASRMWDIVNKAG